jgi:FkbM family methyltransferase
MSAASLRAAISKRIPKSVVKRMRLLLERFTDWPWSRRYFSQLGEDVILLSHLEHTAWIAGKPMRSSGFFVDVGAFSPKLYSNTYLFYKRGWRGVNIDATPGSKRLFDSARKHDTNVEAAISDRAETLTFYSWGTPNVGNTFSREYAAEWEKRMGRPPQLIEVPTRRLESVLDEYVPAGKSIDLMSIDVEGNNLAVLRSNNWDKYSPEYLIVETDTEPATINDILSSPLYSFLQSRNYEMTAWLGISLIFKHVNTLPHYE